MDRGSNTKPIPRRVALFGGINLATTAAAQYIRDENPQTQIRFVTRHEKHRAMLESQFPGAEVAIADYFDVRSLEAAVKDMQGLFVITPDFMDERRAMTNLVYAIRTNRGISHIVRFSGEMPGQTERRLPDYLRPFSGGPQVQHGWARQILEENGLPVTIVNAAANFFQNLTTLVYNPAISQRRVLAAPPNRRLSWVDKTDVGRAAAAVLMSPDQRHIGQTHWVDNGHDLMWMDELADLMTDALGEKITYDGSDETFMQTNAVGMRKKHNNSENAGLFGLALFKWEKDNEVVWRSSDIYEYLTGRKPVLFRDWLIANRDAVLNGPSP